MSFESGSKPEIALEQLRWACEAGIPRGVVLMDPAYGHDALLRTGMTALCLRYVAGIQSDTLMWAPGTTPQIPLRRTKRGRDRKMGWSAPRRLCTAARF